MFQLPATYQAKAQFLQGRTILVTGASRGIGRAVAKSYAAHGATVILLARSVPQLESLYDEIKAAGFPEAIIHPMNLETADANAYENIRSAIEEQFGSLRGLVHCAGILGSLTAIEHYPVEQWMRVLQLNLNSSFILTQTLLPLLKAGKDSSIIFTSADVGKKSRAYWGAYAASKAGLEALMQTLADELETNTKVKVNCIDPGKVATRLRKEAYPSEDPLQLKKPEEILKPYLYLMGDESSEIRGQRIELA